MGFGLMLWDGMENIMDVEPENTGFELPLKPTVTFVF